ncbi:MAG TPA: gamma-glutamylcyclotransferase family protein [Candidatus Acidoferrum sp.]
MYGTLKRGGKFHQELKDTSVRFVDEGRIRGELYQVRGADFPGAVPTSSPSRYVHGQLFALEKPKKTLAAMDDFEEVSVGLFRRELTDVWTSKGRTKAWVYFFARPVDQSDILPSGAYS